MRYLNKTRKMTLTLSADRLDTIKWYIDASFAVHADYKDQQVDGSESGGEEAEVSEFWAIPVSSLQPSRMSLLSFLLTPMTYVMNAFGTSAVMTS